MRISIRLKMAMLIVGTMLLLSSVYTSFFASFFRKALVDTLEGKGRSTISSLSRSSDITYGVTLEIPEYIGRSLEPLLGDPDISFVFIMKDNGILFSSFKDKSTIREIDRMLKSVYITDNVPASRYRTLSGEDVLLFSAPIVNQTTKNTIAMAYVGISLKSVKRTFAQTMNTIAIVTLVIFAAAMALMYVFGSRTLIKPVKNLASAVEKISSGDLTGTIKVQTTDEIGSLSLKFSEMIETLSDDVSSIKGATDATYKIAGELEGISDRILKNSQAQLQNIEKVAASLDSIRQAANNITQNMERLKGMVQEVTTSVFEQRTTSAQTAQEMDTLSKSVEQLFKDIEDFHENIRKVSTYFVEVKTGVKTMLQIVSKLIQSLRNVFERAEGTIKSVGKLTSLVDTSTTAVEGIVETVRAIKGALDEFTKKLGELATKVQNISGVIETIEGFADDTNLLALNASIIAAQAGEQGKSFSVVAQEIKKLSGEISLRAKDISGFVTELMTKVSEASEFVSRITSEAVERAKAHSENLLSASGEIKDDMTNLDTTAKDMLSNISNHLQDVTQISGILQGVDKVVEEIDELFGEQKASSEKIRNFSTGVRDVSVKVKVSMDEQQQTARHISDRFVEAEHLSGSVSQAVREQEQSIRLVFEAISGVKTASRDIASTLDRIVSLVSELNEYAKMLEKVSAKFKV